MQRTVTVFYLELNDISAQPSTADFPGFDFRRALIPCPELNRFFYTTIGKNWNWIDRLPWTKENWFDYLNRPELETWIAYLNETPAGYMELEIQEGQTVQISYLGVLPQFSGKGLGKAMLNSGIRRSRELQARRVWLNTCSLDSPAALKLYKSVGFRVFKKETLTREIPDVYPVSL